MSKHWLHKVPDKFDIEMAIDDRELTAMDYSFADSIVASTDDIFKKAVNYLLPLLNPAREEFSRPPYLNRIEITPTSENTYRIRVEFNFPNDEGVMWWVCFNIPYPFPPFPFGNERTYWPIELGRAVE